MNNHFISPLYLYIFFQLKYQGVKNIGRTNIQKAYDAISLLIDNCCILGFPPTKSLFLKTVYTLLKESVLPRDLRKLKEVKTLLQPYVDKKCC